MKLSNLKLTLESIAPDPAVRSLAVVRATPEFEWLNGKRTETIIGFKVEVAVRKYDTLIVKVPSNLSDKIEKIQMILDEDEEVRVIFENLAMKPYTMFEKGVLRSGVSANAKDFEIVGEIDELSDDLGEVDIT